MNEKFLNGLRVAHESKIVQFGAVASIVMGIALILGGFFYKKKGKTWWVYLVLLGIVSVVTNFIQLA